MKRFLYDQVSDPMIPIEISIRAGIIETYSIVDEGKLEERYDIEYEIIPSSFHASSMPMGKFKQLVAAAEDRGIELLETAKKVFKIR